LVGLGGVDIHTDNDHAFRIACMFGHLETARWLLTVDSARYASSPSCVDKDVHVHDVRLRRWSRARSAWCSWVSQ
jgi:hypothetical protein